MMPVVESPSRRWDAAAWQSAVAQVCDRLLALRSRILVTVLDNTPDFLALDEAALHLGLVHVPLPSFFSQQQVRHAISAVGADTLATASPRGPTEPLELTAIPESLRQATPPLFKGTAKITFTSGTTGTPKGVCLSRFGMESVATSLVEAMRPLDLSRHLSALPYAVLLENVAGVMAARRQGATVLSLPLAQVGLRGSSDFDAGTFDQTVRRYAAQSLILLPQMLKAWVTYLRQEGRIAPESLRFVAVGGAPVGTQWLNSARQLGIPVYEGYGLSEGASVQTLNLPWANRDGTVGRALAHSRIRVAADGEIEVRGSLFLGYVGAPECAATPDAWWPTGDLGHLDADGFLRIEGRKKNVLITSFGRNVSPEWVETALMQEPALPLAVVVGDGQAHLGAVVWTQRPAEQVQAAIDRVNATLPDYAGIGRWVRADPSLRATCFTPNGRPLRPSIESLYLNEAQHELLFSTTE